MKNRNRKNLNTSFELPDDTVRSVEIHPGVAPVETTLAVNNYGPDKEEHEIVKNWVKKVRAIYYAGEKASKKIVVGLVVDSGEHYKNGEKHWYGYGRRAQEAKKLGEPITLFQICVGGEHVLFYYCDSDDNDYRFPKSLADLFADSKTVVAAVGMKALEERLEKQFDLTFPRAADLSRIAAQFNHVFVKPDGYEKFNVMRLAKEVYSDGDAMFDLDEVWRDLSGGGRSMRWWENEGWGLARGTLSEEKVKTGTLQAFLVHEMGMTLLSRRMPLPHSMDALPLYLQIRNWIVR